MTELLIINGRKMLTSREAAILSGWSQNYLGILCRKGVIPGVRTSAQWLIDEEALLAHLKDATAKSAALPADRATIDGRGMVSARLAAKIARCTQDYVTRLVRESKIVGAQHAGGWFIDEDDLRNFLVEKARRKEELRKRIRDERRTIRRLHDQLAAR
jgi:hypothetical protein